VAFVVKDNESFNPVDVSLLSSDAVMFKANEVADLVKEFGHYAILMMEEYLEEFNRDRRDYTS
jgi:hypothetical protein